MIWSAIAAAVTLALLFWTAVIILVIEVSTLLSDSSSVRNRNNIFLSSVDAAKRVILEFRYLNSHYRLTYSLWPEIASLPDEFCLFLEIPSRAMETRTLGFWERWAADWQMLLGGGTGPTSCYVGKFSGTIPSTRDAYLIGRLGCLCESGPTRQRHLHSFSGDTRTQLCRPQWRLCTHKRCGDHVYEG